MSSPPVPASTSVPTVRVLLWIEVSFTATVAVWPATVRLSVSAPSVVASAARVTSMMALPWASTVVVPVSWPPTTSAELTPVML